MCSVSSTLARTINKNCTKMKKKNRNQHKMSVVKSPDRILDFHCRHPPMPVFLFHPMTSIDVSVNSLIIDMAPLHPHLYVYCSCYFLCNKWK